MSSGHTAHCAHFRTPRPRPGAAACVTSGFSSVLRRVLFNATCVSHCQLGPLSSFSVPSSSLTTCPSQFKCTHIDMRLHGQDKTRHANLRPPIQVAPRHAPSGRRTQSHSQTLHTIQTLTPTNAHKHAQSPGRHAATTDPDTNEAESTVTSDAVKRTTHNYFLEPNMKCHKRNEHSTRNLTMTEETTHIGKSTHGCA